VPIKKISDLKTFEEEVLSSDNILIKFEADWCFPCKAMSPLLVDLAKNNPQIKVMAVDIEGDGIYGILNKFEVKSVPTFVRVKNGCLVKKMVGTISRVELSSMVED